VFYHLTKFELEKHYVWGCTKMTIFEILHYSLLQM
jgi:hypothetical protein